MKEPTSRELAERITEVIHKAVAGHVPHGASLFQIYSAVLAAGLAVSRETIVHWVRAEHDARRLTLHNSRWLPGPLSAILVWEKPPQAEPYEQWAAYQADSAPPGTYAPNMDRAWMLRWKAKMLGQRSAGFGKLRVEIRKSVQSRHSCVQVLIVVLYNGGVRTSQNGTAEWPDEEIDMQPLAIEEARDALAAYVRQHQAPEPAPVAV